MRTVVGVFPSREAAESVARELNTVGIPFDEVAIADSTSKDHEKEWSRRNLAAAAGSGFGWFLAGLIPQVAERSRAGAEIFGFSVGGGAGLVAGLGFAALQSSTTGLPPHTLAGAVIGLLIGGAAGGSAATLYNMGVSHERLALAREAEMDHGVVVSAHVSHTREEETIGIMKSHGAIKTDADADAWAATHWVGPHHKEEPYPSDSTFRSHPA
jgi:hypothetical protein